MGLLENVIAGAAGYAVSEISKSHPVRNLVNEKLGKNSNKTIEDVVKEYAPDFNKGHAYMALCCYDLGKSDEFMEYLQKSVEINPREAKIVLGFLFPQGMEPSEYVKYMEARIKKQ